MSRCFGDTYPRAARAAQPSTPGLGIEAMGMEALEEFPEVPTLEPGTKGATGTADHRFAQPRRSRGSSSSAASESGRPASSQASRGGAARSQAAYGAAAVDASADVNITLWRNNAVTSPGVPLTKARLNARKHKNALLPTVQDALDEAARTRRVLPPPGAPRSAYMCICCNACLFLIRRSAAHAVVSRVYALDGHEVKTIEQLQPNGNYMYVCICMQPCLHHFIHSP